MNIKVKGFVSDRLDVGKEENGTKTNFEKLVNHAQYDTKVDENFKKILNETFNSQSLGDARGVVSTKSPENDEVLDFLREKFGVEIIEVRTNLKQLWQEHSTGHEPFYLNHNGTIYEVRGANSGLISSETREKLSQTLGMENVHKLEIKVKQESFLPYSSRVKKLWRRGGKNAFGSAAMALFFAPGLAVDGLKWLFCDHQSKKAFSLKIQLQLADTTALNKNVTGVAGDTQKFIKQYEFNKKIMENYKNADTFIKKLEAVKEQSKKATFFEDYTVSNSKVYKKTTGAAANEQELATEFVGKLQALLQYYSFQYDSFQEDEKVAIQNAVVKALLEGSPLTEEYQARSFDLIALDIRNHLADKYNSKNAAP